MRPNAFITGASRGLGAAIARELAASHDLLLGARTSGALSGILAELPGAIAVPADVRDFGKLAGAVRDVGRLDVLVHNAGVVRLGTVAEVSVDQWRECLEINVIAVAELTRLLLPALRAADGHVVFINSGVGLQSSDGCSAYAASKFAVRAFADALRLEEPRLRVTSVHPGAIDTEMQQTVVAHEGGTYDPGRYMSAQSVAMAVRQAVQAPRDTHPTTVVLRPYQGP